MEGMADVCKIFEEIHMVFFNVQDHIYGWEEGQEAVGVFACFCQKQVGSAWASRRIMEIMEVVVVFPWVPATAMAVL